jgi:CheY-like chemotaxis protein
MKKILVVDDEEHIRKLLMDELGDEGHEIITASDGIEALSLLKDGHVHPELIILDLRMPNMDGLETMGHIIKSRINIPVIIYSAFSGYKEDALAMAAEAYIVKSHDLTELKQTIRRFDNSTG